MNPLLMRCWNDASDNTQPSSSCFEAELRAAEDTVRQLKLQDEVTVIDLVKEYWNEVFEDVFLSGVRSGFMPNADLACNRRVKFGAFPERVKEMFGEGGLLATGHYARVRKADSGNGALLLAARDARKDQSYFLASVRGKDLCNVVFPVGELTKDEVREIGGYAGLQALSRKSSKGICFIGKRSMRDFLEEYVEGEHGQFVDVDTGGVLGDLDGANSAYTIGQRARLGGLAEAVYVVGRRGRDVLVARGGHEKLFSDRVLCATVNWVNGEPPGLAEGLGVSFKGCSTMPRKGATVRSAGPEGVEVTFDERTRRIARGQAVVLYDGDVCLGAAWPNE